MQRVAIARALAMEPDIVLADEPTGNLDTGSGTDVMGALQELWHGGSTLVVVTHDKALAQRANRVIEIPIDQVNDCVRGCCDFCSDMTAEFADISVGSARSKDGWEVDRHWNQVIVRTKAGERLLNLAREKGILEFKAVPPESITKLKAASTGKKTYGESNLKKLKTRLNP